MIVICRWNKYKNSLDNTPINKINPEPGLENKLDIDQMKSFKELKTTIERK
jgi:hypothetical protein